MVQAPNESDNRVIVSRSVRSLSHPTFHTTVHLTDEQAYPWCVIQIITRVITRCGSDYRLSQRTESSWHNVKATVYKLIRMWLNHHNPAFTAFQLSNFKSRYTDMSYYYNSTHSPGIRLFCFTHPQHLPQFGNPADPYRSKKYQLLSHTKYC